MFKKKVNDKDKTNLIQALHIMLENGESNIAQFAKIQLNFYKNRKNKLMVQLLQKFKRYIETDGYGISDALFKSRIISKNEKLILDKSSKIEKGLEYIVKEQKKDFRIKTGFYLLLLPTGLILLALLLTQGIVFDILTKMTQPIKDAGGTPPPLPYYMTTKKIYFMWNALYVTIISSYFLILMFLKKRAISKEFFKFMPLYEMQYSKEILGSIIDLVNNGSSISVAVNTLYKIESDPIKKKIYKDIDYNMTRGRSDGISSVLKRSGLSEDIVMFVEQGEIGSGKTSNIFKYINIAYKIVEDKYERYTKKWLFYTLWGGQFGMILAFLPTLTDILLYTSVSQLNFKV